MAADVPAAAARRAFRGRFLHCLPEAAGGYRVEYLEDDEIVRTRFRNQEGQGYANWDDYLGLEHAEDPNRRVRARVDGGDQ